jgi:hypothetical protein
MSQNTAERSGRFEFAVGESPKGPRAERIRKK